MSVATQSTTTRTLPHWLPVRPKNRLSTRRKSVTIRIPAYHVANVMTMMPVRRGLRFIHTRTSTMTIVLRKS